MNSIVLQSVSKRFANSPAVLQDLDLEVEQGEFLAVIGRSGCGKTTLLNLIGGLDRPSAGKVFVGGHHLDGLDDRRLSHFRNTSVGFIFQTYHLHPRLSALENVMLPCLVGGWKTDRAQSVAAEKLLGLGLGDFLDKMPRTLSGGQMQRVAVARALVMGPSILLADEPTGNLDEVTGHEILKLIAGLNREERLTVLLVTHESEIRQYASRTLLMARGSLRPES